MTWSNFDGKPYNRAQLMSHVATQDFSHWRRKDGALSAPKFITLHNTSEPTIKLWLSWAPEKRQQYIRNMQPYYAGMGWRAGPHFFVPPTQDPCAFGFSDLGTSGTHASCFNSDSIGIEMVGEYASEAFDAGPGAIVRDNAVHLMALLHRRLNLNPANIRFHVECKADNHDCPGRHVSKPDIIARVKAEMAALGGAAPIPSVPAPAPAPAPATRKVLFEAHGSMSTFGGPRDRGLGPDEGLALWASAAQMVERGRGDLLLSVDQAGASGLARRLNPAKMYLACRWNVADYPALRGSVAHVSAKGKTVSAFPVDWGPNTKTGRVADLSPGLAAALDLDTDNECTVVVYADGA
jgi:hypothetical protein